jgi:hypothetical protein
MRDRQYLKQPVYFKCPPHTKSKFIYGLSMGETNQAPKAAFLNFIDQYRVKASKIGLPKTFSFSALL